MNGGELTSFFETFLSREPVFVNKKVLQSNYTPRQLYHRQEQISQLAGMLAPALRLEKPSNIFIYGKTGTGKTCVAYYVAKQVMEIAEQNRLAIKIFYLNCKLKRVADTEYRVIAELARFFGENVPATGLPTDEVYKIFLNSLEREKVLLLIVLDEIDQLVSRAGDGILYNLTRLNSELKNSEISLIGISNDLIFADNLDPRVKSSLSEEEILFPPYNAIQLQNILRQRAEIAFNTGTIDAGVIEKCAAYAAREHGDARRALELLRVAGEIAERKNQVRIAIEDIDEAEEKIERDKIIDLIVAQPKQFRLTLYSIFYVCMSTQQPVFTGEVYETYRNTCKRSGVNPLTQRRISDIIAELDMMGVVNAKVVSKGRYGKTREIGLAIPESIAPKINSILAESLDFE